MKIKIKKSCSFAFEVWNPIEVFEINKIYDLPSNNAHLLIDSGYAEKVEKPEKMEKQEKLNTVETENKMFNVKHKEDKSISAKKRKKSQKK